VGFRVGYVVDASPDLDGDERGDLILAPYASASLLAVSGKDGSVLWLHRNRPLPPGAQIFAGWFNEAALGEPLLVEDVDGDGKPDVVAGFRCGALRFWRFPNPWASQEVQALTVASSLCPRFGTTLALAETALCGGEIMLPDETLVQAVSGRTGQLLWSQPVRAGSGPTGKLLWSRRSEDFSVPPSDFDTDAGPFSLTSGRWRGQPTVTVRTQDRLVTLDLRSGTPMGGPIVLPSSSTQDSRKQQQGLRFFDRAGNGELAFLMPDPVREPDSRQLDKYKAKLTAYSVVSGKKLWEVFQDRLSPENLVGFGSDSRPDLALAVELDGSRKQDLLFPFQDALSGRGGERWFGVELRDGRTGKSLWKRRLFREQDEGPDHWLNHRLLVGPDLNGDGRREIFVACETRDKGRWTDWRRYLHLNVCALSGMDGGSFWKVQFPETLPDSGLLDPLSWWQPDVGGRPQLVVPRVNHMAPRECKTWVLDAASGRVNHSVAGLESVGTADFDGDGLTDLYGYSFRVQVKQGTSSRTIPGPRKLHVFRAAPPEQLRLLGAWRVTGDFAGEGHRALLLNDHVVSGRDGRPLWQNPRNSQTRGWPGRCPGCVRNGCVRRGSFGTSSPRPSWAMSPCCTGAGAGRERCSSPSWCC
jgi:hypothetical protein